MRRERKILKYQWTVFMVKLHHMEEETEISAGVSGTFK